MADKISGVIPKFCPHLEFDHQPLTLPKTLNRYSGIVDFVGYRKVLSGITLDTSTVETAANPPSLNLWLSEQIFLQDHPANAVKRTWDVDSILFFPTSLAVFKDDVEFSFLPPFNRSGQQNQRVSIASISMTETKCIFFCNDGRYDCHVFFPGMTKQCDAEGKETPSQTQHLNNYALGIWTDRIVLPSFDALCDTSTRQHYPTSFLEIHTKGNVKREAAVREGAYSHVDVRKALRPALFDQLWQSIVSLSHTVTGTHLPDDSFRNPTLFVSNHNLKTSRLGGHSSFEAMHTTFERVMDYKFDMNYVVDDAFWVDVGSEVSSNIPGSTILRKACCNREYANYLTHRSGGVKVSTYIMCCTDAGSITVETRPKNPIRAEGLAYCKAYNPIKEQFYTAYRDHSLFQDRNIELLAYSKAQLEMFAVGDRAGGIATSVTKEQLVHRVEASKERLTAALLTRKADTASYSDRRESRLTLQLLRKIPADYMSDDQLAAETNETSHKPFFILPTADINAFRAADANRFILCLEKVIPTSTPGIADETPVVVQQRNSLMSTAMARTLKLSLGGGNPYRQPSLWLGKRWVERRTTRGKNSRNKAYARRQGLEYGESAESHGMIWLPDRMIEWGDAMPYFRLRRYRHLDIAFSALHDSEARRAVAEQKTYQGKLLQYIHSEIIRVSLTPGTIDTQKTMWKHLFARLADICVQQYNLHVLDILKKRWRKHVKGTPAQRERFEQKAKLTPAAQDGTEVLTFSSLTTYLEANLKHPGMLDARAHGTSTFVEWDESWAGRVIPLFDPGPDRPAWINNSRMGKRIAEIEARITESTNDRGPGGSSLCQTFRSILHRLASTRVQVLLAYNKSGPSTLKDVPKRRDDPQTHITEFERTKFMFPRVSSVDAKVWLKLVAAAASNPKPGIGLSATKIRNIMARWAEFNQIKHKGEYKTFTNLMRDGRTLGPQITGWLDLAIELHKECNEWLEEVEAEEDEEISDWEVRPDLEDMEDETEQSSTYSDG